MVLEHLSELHPQHDVSVQDEQRALGLAWFPSLLPEDGFGYPLREKVESMKLRDRPQMFPSQTHRCQTTAVPSITSQIPIYHQRTGGRHVCETLRQGSYLCCLWPLGRAVDQSALSAAGLLQKLQRLLRQQLTDADNNPERLELRANSTPAAVSTAHLMRIDAEGSF